MAWRQATSIRVRHVEYSDEVLRGKQREGRLLNEELDRLARLENIAMRRLTDVRKRIASERLPLQTQSQTTIGRSRPVSIAGNPPAIGALGAMAPMATATAAPRGGESGVRGATGTRMEAASLSRRISCPAPPPTRATTNATPFPALSRTTSGGDSGSSSKKSSINSSDSR